MVENKEKYTLRIFILQPTLQRVTVFANVKYLLIELLSSSADIWPYPREGEDPYSMEGIPEDLNYELQLKDGIIHVYESAEALKQEQAYSLPYPDLETFAIDLSHVLAMIADGPT